MNVIRKLNIFLLIVALILMLIFIPKACKEGDNKGKDGGNSPSHTHHYYAYYNSSQHWEECSCGSIRNSSFHVYSSGKCYYCGYKDPSHTHSYTTVKYDEYECWEECSCGAKTNVEYHYYSNGKCYYCGYKDPSHTHSYTTLKSNDKEHWYECFCGEKTNVSYHSGSATCTKKAFCTTCNKEYGGYANHTYSSTYSFSDSKHWLVATCGCDLKKSEGSHVIVGNSSTCSVCSYPVKATEGVLYDLSSDGTYAEVIGYSGDNEIVRIASTYQNLPVKTIYQNAFYDTGITGVIIPDSVTSIGSSAFYDCDSLKNVIIGNGVTSIGSDAFYNCDALTSVTIGSGVTSIDDGAFAYCGSLSYVNYLGTIDGWSQISFYDTLDKWNCANPVYYAGDLHINGKLVTEVKLTTATKISSCAFYYCDSITSVEIGDSVTSIGSSAFYNCSSLEDLELGTNLNSIGYDVFYGCSKLFVLKDNINYIKANGNDYYIAYSVENEKLSSYTIQSGTKLLGNGLFGNCDRLGSIVIPDSVTNIGKSAFYDCDSLTSVTIGSGVTSIGYEAFYSCDSLTSVTIGSGVTSIGYEAFYSCDKLSSVKFNDTSTWYRTNNYDNFVNKTGGTKTSVTNTSDNAYNLKSNYYWYKV